MSVLDRLLHRDPDRKADVLDQLDWNLKENRRVQGELLERLKNGERKGDE